MYFNHQKPSLKTTSDFDDSFSSGINPWPLSSGDPSLFPPLVSQILNRVIPLFKGVGLQLFKAVIALIIITQNAQCQTKEPSTEEIVTAFKQFLENPPIIEEMVFDRIQLDPAPDWEGPLQEIFQVRHQKGDYFFRKLKSIEDADTKNLHGDMFMASRFQTNCWTFSNGIFEHAVGNFGDELNLEFPISFTMYTAKMMMFEGMHFGMGHIKPYSLHWNGDTFNALTWEGKAIVGNLNYTSHSLPDRIVYNIAEDHRDYIHTFTFNDIISSPGMPTDVEVSIAFGGRLQAAMVDRSYHYYKYVTVHRLGMVLTKIR